MNNLQIYSPRPKIYFMTAFADKEMAISLLNLGVNGLIEKPFSTAELMKILGEASISEGNDHEIFQDWAIDPVTRTLKTEQRSIELTEVELKLLTCLLSQRSRWVSREEVVDHIWGPGSRSRNVLDTHLTNLKRKVPEIKNHLRVVRGKGYMLSKGSSCID